MQPTGDRSALHEINLTTARNLSPWFDEAVRHGRPVSIVRGGRERGMLLSRETLLDALRAYKFRVNVLPEDDGGFTLWLRELNVAANGRTLREARSKLLSVVRSFTKDYYVNSDLYRQLPDLACMAPYVLLLSLADDDAQMISMLFGVERAGDDKDPRARAEG